MLRDAATVYKVDADTITAKVKQKFTVKDKAKSAKQSTPKQPVKSGKTIKKAAAA